MCENLLRSVAGGAKPTRSSGATLLSPSKGRSQPYTAALDQGHTRCPSSRCVLFMPFPRQQNPTALAKSSNYKHWVLGQAELKVRS